MLRRALRHPLSVLTFTLLLLVVLHIGFEPTLRPLLSRAVSGWGQVLSAQVVRLLIGSFLSTVAVLVAGRWLEQRRPAELGLGVGRLPPELAWGGLVGAGLMGAVVLVFALCGWYRLVDGPAETLQEETREALASLLLFALVAYSEELFCRGILFRLVEEWLGSAAALVLSSLFFGWMHLHNPGATGFTSLAIALEAGLMLGAAFMLTRSLWFAVGIHWMWNWVQGGLLGVAVSGMEMDGLLDGRLVGPPAWTGGVFGAEGGYVAILVCTAAGVALTWAAVRRGQWRPVLHWHRGARREGDAAAVGRGESAEQLPAAAHR